MRKILLAVMIAAGLVYLAGCGLSDDTVAKVGGTSISAEVFKAHLARQYSKKDSYADVDSATKMAVINRIVEKELKALAAKDMGLDETPEFLAEIKNQKSRIMGNRYFEINIVDKLFPEEVILDEFNKTKTQVKASHVLISFKGAQGGKATRTKEQALSLAKEISSRAMNGEGFASLAEKYSDDPSAKGNKGDLGYFTSGKMVKEFADAAFSMEPNEISDPVETAFGYHVIKVADRRDDPNFDPDGFESQKFAIKRQLYFTKKDSGLAMWNDLTANVREQYNFEFNEENMKKVGELPATKDRKADADAYTDEEKNLVLASWSGGSLKFNDMILAYGKRFSSLKANLSDLEKFKKEVEGASLVDLIISESEKSGIDQEPEIQAQLQDFINNKLSSLAEAEAVRKKAEVSDEELEEYYNANQNEFKKPAEIELWEIYVTDEALANKIAKKAEAGSDFEALAKKYTEDKTAKDKNGYLGFKEQKRRGAVSKAAFELGPNKIGGPVKYRRGWAVFKTGALKEESLRDFDSVRGRVMSKARSEKMKELKTAWDENLRDKYSVKINTELVEKI